MNKKFYKVLSLVLCAVILVGGSIGATTVYALNAEKSGASEGDTPSGTKNEDRTENVKKDETVYVLAGADGSVKKIIVSDWIRNMTGSDSITDRSDLDDIENLKGDGSYTMNGDNLKVWNTESKDLYYRGNIEKDLPVTLSVTYLLDGKTVSAEELAGKSGKVTIRFDYRNNQCKPVTIDGKEEKIYVPFAMLTGVLLDGKSFSEVTVTNGKVINDGDRIAVVGVALPGLQENLGLDSEEFEIPSSVEITATVKNFSLGNTVTIATNELFNRIPDDIFDKADELGDSVNALSDAVNTLVDGSSELFDGLCTLLEKSGELIDGIDKLESGLKELNSHSAELNAGAKQVFETLLETATKQLTDAGLTVPELTIENYEKTLDAVIASLEESVVRAKAEERARETVTAAVEAQRETIKAAVSAAVRQEVETKVTAAVRTNVEDQVLATMGTTRQTYEAALAAGMITEAQQTAFTTAVDAQMETETVKATITAQTDAQMSSAEMIALIEEKTDEQVALQIETNMASDTVKEKVETAVEKAKAGAVSVKSLKEQLNSYNEFYTGLLEYTAGVSEAYAGALELKNGTPALKTGICDLKNGAGELSDGLKEFREKGVQKLTDAVNGTMKELTVRLHATLDVSKAYQNFSGISDDMNGQVKFVYRTDAIPNK